MHEIQQRLRRLEKRDWWLWWAAVLVMLLLTVGVVSMSFPALMQLDRFIEIQMELAVRGLVGLVLLFNTYSIYQQVMIKRLRRQLSEQLEVMVRLETRAEEFHKLAMNDPLTGLHNRRFAEARLHAEVDRSRRHGHPLTVLLLDLDKFKQTNDRFGHGAGDLVLKEFGARLSAIVRVSDIAARIGGDEFMIVLPECPEERVYALLERLGRPEIHYRGQRIPIGYSAGWAGYRQGELPEQLVERADKHLYSNKRARRAEQLPAPRFRHPLKRQCKPYRLHSAGGVGAAATMAYPERAPLNLRISGKLTWPPGSARMRRMKPAGKSGRNRGARREKRAAGKPKSLKKKVLTKPAVRSVGPLELVSPAVEQQLKQFEQAMQLFQQQKFAKARQEFERVAAGPGKELADRARLHLRMCEQRLAQQPAARPRTAEEHYHHGVAMMNLRHWDEARDHLEKARKLAPKADHIIYALAALDCLTGEADQALEKLKLAIQLRPENRYHARNDQDFAFLQEDPRFTELLYPEREIPA